MPPYVISDTDLTHLLGAMRELVTEECEGSLPQRLKFAVNVEML